MLIRTDSGGGTHDFLDWVTARRLKYSIGFTLTEEICAAIGKIPLRAWTPAWDEEGEPRDGAWVTEITGMLDLSTWPKGMLVIVRKQRPHPGAQLRFTDIDGHRFISFVTASRRGKLAELELRHRRRARCEDRIRNAKDTGLRNLPLHGFDQNQIWCEIITVASELTAWMQMLALPDHPARRWEPKRLRLRVLAAAARLVKGGRRLRLRIATRWRWADLLATATPPTTDPASTTNSHNRPDNPERKPTRARGTRPPDATTEPPSPSKTRLAGPLHSPAKLTKL